MSDEEEKTNFDWFREQVKMAAQQERESGKYHLLNIPPPVLELKLEHMRHTLAVYLSHYADQLDEMLMQAVESYCTAENLANIICAETNRVMNQVIKEEVNNWFLRGDGRKVIKAAVEKRLREGKTYTPLDDE